MASEVDICNLALARLGDNATVASIDPPEGSVQAEHCARFFPLARDTLLEAYPWNFATRRARLARIAAESMEWAYIYARPADAIRALAVFEDAPLGRQADPQEFEASSDGAGNPLILANVPDACLRYVARVNDTASFSPLFVDALAWMLAAYLAGPVLKGDAGAAAARQCQQSFRMTLSSALESDANQHRTALQKSPPWISNR
jgi:hypothetical protein